MAKAGTVKFGLDEDSKEALRRVGEEALRRVGEQLTVAAHNRKLLGEVGEEMLRARRKHLPLVGEGNASYYAALESRAKMACDNASAPTWDLILLEEVYEALASLAAGDLEAGRAELVQVLAMTSSMIEIIDGGTS